MLSCNTGITPAHNAAPDSGSTGVPPSHFAKRGDFLLEQAVDVMRVIDFARQVELLDA